MTALILKTVDDRAWEHTILHPERGMLTLDDLLKIYSEHVQEHIDQIWAVYKNWVEHYW